MIRTVLVILSLLCASFATVAIAQDKRIALSFDDVPRGEGAYFTSDERTQLIIDGLREAGVEQAAFFLNPGRIAEQQGAQERIAAYVAAGHVIANHTNTHPRLSATSIEEYLADLDAASDWLKDRVLGETEEPNE